MVARLQYLEVSDLHKLEAWLREQDCLRSLMQTTPGAGHDGRPFRDDVTNSVNGREVRASGRWQATPQGDEPAPCYSIMASTRRYRERGSDAAVAAAEGSGRAWAPFKPAARERGAQRRRQTGKPSVASLRLAADARLRDRIGTTVGLADGTA